MTRRCHPQSLSLSTHSRIYAGQFSSFTPSASQRTRKPITSRSTQLTSFRSKTVAAIVRLEFKKTPQLGDRPCFDSATQDEDCECLTLRCLNPKSHRSRHVAVAAVLHCVRFHPSTIPSATE